MAALSLGTYDDSEHRRLPNSLPVVGRALAEEVIGRWRLEEPALGRRCWPERWPSPSKPNHLYVRALFGVYNAGGTLMAMVVCGRCGHGRRSVSRRDLTAHSVALDSVPILADYRRDYCERCGTIGAQLHHMAPQALFEDANNWPTAYLCQPCHAEWHRTMKSA